MSKLTPWIVMGSLWLAAFGACVQAADKQTWTGEYQWDNGGTGDLRAVFTAKGENRWKVAFHFRFDKKNRVFKGTAEGSLEAGQLTGTVKDGRKRRTFEAKVADGVLEGPHFEVGSDGPFATGTLKLSRGAATD